MYNFSKIGADQEKVVGFLVAMTSTGIILFCIGIGRIRIEVAGIQLAVAYFVFLSLAIASVLSTLASLIRNFKWLNRYILSILLY